MKAFDHPTTPFNERLDEIVAIAHDWKPIDRAWPPAEGIAWLRGAFARHWDDAYPQPYIGAGPDDAMLSLCWMADDENATLEVDTVNRTGDLLLASSHGSIDVECVFDLDLDDADALAASRVRIGGRSWPTRESTGYRYGRTSTRTAEY